jgi:hypothetical protein
MVLLATDSINLRYNPFASSAKGAIAEVADGWQSLAERPSDQIIDLATDALTSSCRKSNTNRDGTRNALLAKPRYLGRD